MMGNVIHKGASDMLRLKEQRRARTKEFWKGMGGHLDTET